MIEEGVRRPGRMEWPATAPAGGAANGRMALLEALAAYRRGIREAPVVCKWGIGIAEATGLPRRFARNDKDVAGGGPLVFVASTGEVDRHGDTVAPEGWRLAGYRENPVVLWAHDYRLPAIGRADAVWSDGRALLARLEFAPTEFAGQVERLYRQGYQRGVSVGFRPLRFEERRDPVNGAFLGIRFLEQELLEISAVPVPANGDALLANAGALPASVGALPASVGALPASVGANDYSPLQKGRELAAGDGVAAMDEVVGLLRGLRG